MPAVKQTGQAALNQIASYFNAPPSSNSQSSGNGDADTATAHAKVNDELVGSICPDCHTAVKGAMVKVFGQPAGEADASEQPSADTAAPKIAVPDVTKINYPKGSSL